MGLAELTDAEINIAIAKELGWRCEAETDSSGFAYWRVYDNDGKNIDWGSSEANAWLRACPTWSTDMSKALALTLTSSFWNDYGEALDTSEGFAGHMAKSLGLSPRALCLLWLNWRANLWKVISEN